MKIPFFIFLVLPAFLLLIIPLTDIAAPGFSEQREQLLSDMDSMIHQAKLDGKYRCCIEPPCRMCFLGNWIWDDGTCDCDGEIAKENWDKVCPECKNGMEQGICESATEQCIT